MKQFSEKFMHVVRAYVYSRGTEYSFLSNYFMYGNIYVQTLFTSSRKETGQKWVGYHGEFWL